MSIGPLLFIVIIILLLAWLIASFTEGDSSSRSASSHISSIGSSARSQIDRTSADYLKRVRDNTKR